MEGWRVASKWLGALPRIHRGALGRGCGSEGGGALPLPMAAAVSTGLRVLFWTVPRSVMKVISWYLVRVRVRIPNRVRVMPRWPRCAKGVERLCLGA